VNGEADVRKLFIEIDYGERWDAEHIIDHPYMPPGVNTRDPDGATMGRYRGHLAGHVFRGTDMTGNQVLTKDYDQGTGLPVGTKDTTVTVTVSDGINTATKTFTVRLSHFLRYYTDTGQTTYGVNSYRGTGASANVEVRRGVIYVSADGDFTGAEIGPNIYHFHVPTTSNLRNFGTFYGMGRNLTAAYGETLRNTANATQIIGGVACDAGGTPVPTLTDWPWNGNGPTYAVLFKSGPGNVYHINQDGLWTDRLAPGANSLFMSWGGGRAEISCDAVRRWGKSNQTAIKTLTYDKYFGIKFHNLLFKQSDLDVTDPEQRIWWNVLYYENKVGSFNENNVDSLLNFWWDSELIRNPGGTKWTQIISDWPDASDPTRGYLIVRQVLDQEQLDFDEAIGATEVEFTDGEQLVGNTSGATATFVQAPAWGTVNDLRGVDATSRQGRPNRTYTAFWGGAAGTNSPGVIGGVFDKCIVKGFRTVWSAPGSWFFRSDTAAIDIYDYSHFGRSHCLFDSAYLTANPYKANPDPDNYVKDVNAPSSDNKQIWNSNKDNLPGIPTKNGVSHSCVRHQEMSSWAQHKCSSHWYGGHLGLTDFSIDGGSGWGQSFSSGFEQPGYRMAAVDAPEVVDNPGRLNVNLSGCVYCGGGLVFQWFDDNVFTRPPHWLVYDNCIIHAGRGSGNLLNFGHSRSAFKNCEIGFPSYLDLLPRGTNLTGGTVFHIAWTNGDVGLDPAPWLPDLTPVAFVDNCDFIYSSGNMNPAANIQHWTDQRGREVPFTNCTVTIGQPDSTPGVPALQPSNVAPIPT